MNNALIRTSNDSKRTKIRLIVAGGSYMNSPIAPNVCVYLLSVFISIMSAFESAFTI